MYCKILVINTLDYIHIVVVIGVNGCTSVPTLSLAHYVHSRGPSKLIYVYNGIREK